MVPGTSPHTPAEASTTDEHTSTVINALIGAVTGIVLSFIPLSTLLGGAVAGYLNGGNAQNGLKVGAFAGVIMLLPFMVIGLAMIFFLGFGSTGAPIAFGIMAIFILMLGGLYTVGLSAVGGYLGIYIKNEM